MLILVDANSGVPVYRQLVDQIRLQIASGMLAPGSELPSTRVLSQELGVNPMTVSKAYVLLEKEGFLERRPGLPLVVSEINYIALEDARLETLRTVLQPAIVAARQLDVSPTAAARLLRQMLEDARREVEA